MERPLTPTGSSPRRSSNMPTSKRASMREGPLAALFRKTTEDAPGAKKPEEEPPAPERKKRTQPAAHDTLHIGDSLTRGLGSGSDPDLGRRAAIDEHDRIKAMLRGADMVFIAAGAGGGTGTGAAPIVAQISRELGALTVGIITRPFQFEGSRRRDQAEAGIKALSGDVDTLIVVPNNRLLSVLDRNTSMVEAFRVADDVLRQGVQGISDLVTLPGLINLDFADVR